MQRFGKINLLTSLLKKRFIFLKKDLECPFLKISEKTILFREWFFFMLILALILLVMASYIHEKML
jgi:hypothetical protein